MVIPVGDIEKRIGNPRLQTLQQLADTLGVEVAALFAKPAEESIT